MYEAIFDNMATKTMKNSSFRNWDYFSQNWQLVCVVLTVFREMNYYKVDVDGM